MSQLARLRDRLDAARARRVLDLSLRDLREVMVRYRPLDAEQLHRARELQDVGAERGVRQSAGFLADACVAILELVDGRWVSADPDDRDGAMLDEDGTLMGERPLTFGGRLHEILSLEDPPNAVACVRALYGFDGDVVAAGNRVLELSGFAAGRGGVEDADFSRATARSR